MSLKGAREVLRLLTEAFPPAGETPHSLELEGDQLVLWLWYRGVWASRLPLSISEAELELEPAEVVDEVRRFLERAGVGAKGKGQSDGAV